MPQGRKRSWTPENSILFAQSACLCFGLGLMLWGVAPAIVARVVTGEPPSAHALILNSAIFVVAGLFVMLQFLIRRRIRWAVWTAFLLACLFLGAGIAVSTVQGIVFASMFVMCLSALTCFASWLAISAVSPSLSDLDDASALEAIAASMQESRRSPFTGAPSVRAETLPQKPLARERAGQH